MNWARRLIQAGIVGAGVFVLVVIVLSATRASYDPDRHFVSILSLGDGGWIQIANFVIGGLLIAGLGVGLSRRWRSGPGARSIPRLVMVAGVGLVGCGVFIPDPSLGYPPGTPNVLVTPLTWHGALHYVSATAILLALTAAVLLAIRRGLAPGQVGLTAASLAVAVLAIGGCGAALILSGSPPTEIIGLMERIGVFAGWTWLALIGLIELRAPATSGG